MASEAVGGRRAPGDGSSTYRAVRRRPEVGGHLSVGERLPVCAFQWDLARQTERFDWLLAQLPRYADWGYRELYLHLEDAIEYPRLPGVARPGAYSPRQMARLAAAADQRGIKLVPIVNLWGHTQYLLKVPELRDLNELRGADGSPLPRGQICPLHPRTLEVAEKLLRDVAPLCTAGKVHVGLDESYDLGRHPLSRAEIAEFGLAVHFSRYVGRLHCLAAEQNLRLGIWADMLALLPQAIALLPARLSAYDWYYYPFRRRPRIELRNFREYDLVPALRRRGIEYWGCAMDGSFHHEPLPVFGDRIGNLLSWWRRCRAVGAEGFLVSSWEPSRMALEMATVVDAAAACLWLEPEIAEPRAMLERGFARVFGKKGAARAARTAWAADVHPFSGYRRWEINARWDVSADREPIERFEKEERLFRRLARVRSPAPLAASLALRRYLAARDVFVRTAAKEVFRLRRGTRKRFAAGGVGPPGRPVGSARPAGAPYLSAIRDLDRAAARFGRELARGRAAARAMWRRTRSRRERGPNECILEKDKKRLRQWRRWLARVRRRPALIRAAAPVCGAWQFRATLRNFAPALQQIVLEQRDEWGGWEVRHRRILIEFQAAAAAPRTRQVQEFSAPIDDPTLPLRLALRGLGQVGVENLELTNGTVRLRLEPPRRKKVLGRPAPPRGFPEINWSANRDAWALKVAGARTG